MVRPLSAALLTITLVAPTAFAQGPVQRAGQAIDNAGRKVRGGVENAVARGKMNAQERELLGRVTSRIAWDKQLVGSTIQVEVQADGTTVLRGSTISEATKQRAVDLVENTLGVTAVVDELAVVKDVKILRAAPATRVVEVPAPVTAVPAEVIVPNETKVVVPSGTKVIVKP